MDNVQTDKPKIIEKQNSKGVFGDTDITYNEGGLTYNEVGQIYGGGDRLSGEPPTNLGIDVGKSSNIEVRSK